MDGDHHAARQRHRLSSTNRCGGSGRSLSSRSTGNGRKATGGQRLAPSPRCGSLCVEVQCPVLCGVDAGALRAQQAEGFALAVDNRPVAIGRGQGALAQTLSAPLRRDAMAEAQRPFVGHYGALRGHDTHCMISRPTYAGSMPRLSRITFPLAPSRHAAGQSSTGAERAADSSAGWRFLVGLQKHHG